MAYSGTTTHYGLPKYVSTDKPSWLDTNDGFETIDQALYAAAQAVDPAQIAQMQNDITALQTGKQNVLTFDATPTSGSVNPVTSGGVYTSQRTMTEIASNTSTGSTMASRISSLVAAFNSLTDGEKAKSALVVEISGVLYIMRMYITTGVFYAMGINSGHPMLVTVDIANSLYINTQVADSGNTVVDLSTTVQAAISKISLVVTA